MKLPLGAQIWSLRNLISDNPESVFERLSSAGYTFIEPAGFNLEEKTIQGFAPKELQKIAGYQGLTIKSGHFEFEPEDVHLVCECAAEMGMKYIVTSSLKTKEKQYADAYKVAADELNKIGEAVNMYNLQFAYHNHAHEFNTVDGIVPYDILLSHTDAENVVFEMDMSWVVYGGYSPVVYFNQYPNRFPLWHLRDIDIKTTTTTMVGEGDVDFNDIFAHSHLAGLKLPLVEMASGMTDPLDKICNSIPKIKSFRI